ncbi:hypothetical protein [Paenibacillus sinensis]|nr:hypothetical protein [Paenibacillus sinensis]
MRPAEPLTIYWAKPNEGLYKTVAGPDTTKSYPVMKGSYENVLYENYESIYALKLPDKQSGYPSGDIYRLNMPVKTWTRLTYTGNIDYFYFSNNSIYYVTSSLTIEPGVYRMSMEGNNAVRVNASGMEARDQHYQYYFGFNYYTQDFALRRKPLSDVTNDETYIRSDEDTYYEEEQDDKSEKLSTYEVYMNGYIWDVESDQFVFSERDSDNRTSYLHLFKNGKETVRKLKGWQSEPLDIIDGWVYFTVASEDTDAGALFAIRPDGSGFRQVGNKDLYSGNYLGTIKSYLVFQHLNQQGIPDGGFTFIKKQ